MIAAKDNKLEHKQVIILADHDSSSKRNILLSLNKLFYSQNKQQTAWSKDFYCLCSELIDDSNAANPFIIV